MKAKAKKPVPRARKKPAARKSAPSAANGVSSPYGYRIVENKWLNKHPEKLRDHAGEYVVVEGRRIVAHNRDAALAVQTPGCAESRFRTSFPASHRCRRTLTE